MRCIWNSWTSFLLRFPFKNSFHASRRFSGEMISSWLGRSLLRPPPQRNLPSVLEKIKSAYLVWHDYHNILPKTQRYSLGNKIDKIFIAVLELISFASFLNQEEKLPYVKRASRQFDTLKIMLLILWETKSLDNKKYIALSVSLDEAGKMLGGWLGH